MRTQFAAARLGRRFAPPLVHNVSCKIEREEMLLGAMLNALLSLVIALATWKVRHTWLRLLIVVGCAYGSAHLIFSAWLWLGPSDPQTSSWSPAFINGWFLAGVLPGCIAVLIASTLKKHNVPPSSS